MIDFRHGDNRQILRQMIDDGVRVDSVVTDPPYGLTSIIKRFGKQGSAPALSNGPTGVFKRASGGFMGQTWDGTQIERDPEFWRLVYDVMKPGAYCLAFSGARTGHWQAVAMEQAGFIMHPMIGWVSGQGFPKAHAADLEGWDGWAYGTQSMKPALEPIYFAQKPFSEKTGAANILKHGVGAINIDACRVGGAFFIQVGDRLVLSPGRHPANLVHDGSDAVVALFPESKGQQGDVRGTEPSRTGDENTHCYGKYGRVPAATRNDSGSAARFFNSFRYACDKCHDTGRIDDGDMSAGGYVLEDCSHLCPVCAGESAVARCVDPIIYHPKATKADRAGSKHPTVKPIRLLRWLCRLITPPGGTILDPFAGSGTTGAAALSEGFSAILIEKEDSYAADIRQRFNLLDGSYDFDQEYQNLVVDNFSLDDIL